MPEPGFFRRWARLKAQGGTADVAVPPEVRAPSTGELPPLAQATPHPPVAPAPPDASGAAPPRPLPTLEDAARLNADSDFSAFVTQGVDKAVQRLAMKTLFSDPHFNLMDGLDVYIDDYNKSDPVPSAMLAALQHAKSLFLPTAPDEQAANGEAAPRPPEPPNPAPPPQTSQGDA